MAELTVQQASRLYELVGELEDSAAAISDHWLLELTDSDTTPEARAELIASLVVALGELRDDWWRLVAFARRVPAVAWPTDETAGGEQRV